MKRNSVEKHVNRRPQAALFGSQQRTHDGFEGVQYNSRVASVEARIASHPSHHSWICCIVTKLMDNSRYLRLICKAPDSMHMTVQVKKDFFRAKIILGSQCSSTPANSLNSDPPCLSSSPELSRNSIPAQVGYKPSKQISEMRIICPSLSPTFPRLQRPDVPGLLHRVKATFHGVTIVTHELHWKHLQPACHMIIGQSIQLKASFL